MSEVDPALFFIPLIVVVIFAIYQSRSLGETKDKNDLLKNKHAKKAFHFEKLDSHAAKNPQANSICYNKVNQYFKFVGVRQSNN